MRNREVKIRATEEEYALLLERKTKVRLAEWLRELGLGENKVVVNKADPELLYTLAKIGGNINQIARACNTKRLDKYESVKVLMELKEIKNRLDEILNVS